MIREDLELNELHQFNYFMESVPQLLLTRCFMESHLRLRGVYIIRWPNSSVKLFWGTTQRRIRCRQFITSIQSELR